MIHLSTDVLVIGAGGAGMYAAVSAARSGAAVILADKSLIGRGGATIMAQMTVAAAMGHQEPDHWTHHLADTVKAGRGLCDERLSAILCEEAPIRIREMDEWGTGWARDAEDRYCQVMAPGHQVARCVYADFLNTGPAVARALRGEVAQNASVTRISGLCVVELVVREGRCCGALAIDAETGEAVTLAAGAVVLAGGGLTRLFARNSASVNMTGDSFALALRAGAELIDMEFVQFFPIGHLAPRLVGMDPIMWDPFRYKLGGRLLNGEFSEFIDRYGSTDSGKYTAARDIASYAIFKEVEAGRGSPHGGAWLSFEHIPAETLRAAFGPVIDRLAANGIDLAKGPIEVSPIAHYHMGGIRVEPDMRTRVPGLFAAGEAVGGANGANRLSGNAIPEAFVFGERAGRFGAAEAASQRARWDGAGADGVLEEARDCCVAGAAHTPAATGLYAELQALMWDKVGLLRSQAKMDAALDRIRAMRASELGALAVPSAGPYNQALLDWFDLRASLLTAEAVTLSASGRHESRGAHQREDMPDASPALERNQTLALAGEALTVAWSEVPRQAVTLEDKREAVA
jgi:succinate dehydrogenase/fumarate reductase flavoprotein subunit